MKKIALLILTLLLSFTIWAEAPQKSSERPTLTELSGTTDGDLKAMLAEAWNLGYKAAAQSLNPDLLAARQEVAIERGLRRAAETGKAKAEANLWPWMISTAVALVLSGGAIFWHFQR